MAQHVVVLVQRVVARPGLGAEPVGGRAPPVQVLARPVDRDPRVVDGTDAVAQAVLGPAVGDGLRDSADPYGKRSE